MSGNQAQIFLRNTETEKLEEAILFDAILNKHLDDIEKLWGPFRQNAVQGLAKAELPQSSHWDWKEKVSAIKGYLAFPCFAIECKGETQGLMIVNTAGRCRLDSQKNKPLLYRISGVSTLEYKFSASAKI